MKVDAVPHGIRSTFRDWCSEFTSYAHEVAEMALAHTISSAVEKAYRRGNLFAKRTRLMQDWCRFLNQSATGEVAPIRKHA
jgi:integrase